MTTEHGIVRPYCPCSHEKQLLLCIYPPATCTSVYRIQNLESIKCVRTEELISGFLNWIGEFLIWQQENLLLCQNLQWGENCLCEWEGAEWSGICMLYERDLSCNLACYKSLLKFSHCNTRHLPLMTHSLMSVLLTIHTSLTHSSCQGRLSQHYVTF